MKLLIGAALVMAIASPALAEKPRLIIAISVDQFSADLFEKYRPSFTGGLKTLSAGVTFSNGYQSHAASETCPGHATILSGIRPARSGIVANDWYGTRGAKPVVETYRDEIYCVEDETNPASTVKASVVSLQHVSADFKTFGDRLKVKYGAKARVFAVAGKDRAAVLMGGRTADQTWWYDASKSGYATYSDTKYGNIAKSPPQIVAAANAEIAALLKTPPAPPALSPSCAALVKPLTVGGITRIAAGGVAPTSDANQFRSTLAADAKTLEIATGLLSEFDLGRKGSTDVLAISLSTTDIVGHAYGPDGPEMCAQLEGLDARLADFLGAVEKTGKPFAVMLTADHGGIDIPERNSRATGRSALGLGISALNQAVRGLASIKDPSAVLVTSKGGFGDIWLTDNVPDEKRALVTAFLQGAIKGIYGVETVFTRAEIMATSMPSGAPDKWSLIERVRASYLDGRSGHLFVVLKDGLSPIPVAGRGFVATHGSPWDYDRRVPMLFWWPGVKGGDRPDAVETVDILPTLASLIGLKIDKASVDGRCLNLGAGSQSNCH